MMANPAFLSDTVKMDLARQIAERMPRTVELAAPGAALGMGESLKVQMLRLDALNDVKGAMSDRVSDTRQWHHQIYGARTPMFARSIADVEAPGSAHRVVELATSPLTTALERTIEWVDQNIPGDAQADVLVVPAYFLTGLWIHGAGVDSVVISSMADGLKGLELNSPLDSQEFLQRLAENEPVEGLGPPPAIQEGGIP
jgi:hypothetical protein